jgi:hypothetical protein
MSATQRLVQPCRHKVLGNIREDRPIVIAVGRCNERRRGRTVRPFSFISRMTDLLVVHDAAFVMQLGSHTPAAVRRPLGAYRLDLLDKPSFADRLELRLIVVC